MIPKPPRAVLFDMDGVLVDTFDAWVAVLDECRVRRGLPPLGPAVVRATWGQGIQADCRTFFPGADPALLAREYDEGFARSLDLVRPEDGIGDVVGAIRAAGIPTAVVTNSPVAMTRRILGRIGLPDAFDAIAGGEEVPRGKPDPALVFLALKRLRVPAALAVLIGDTRLDVEAARAAGVPVVGYRVDGADARVERIEDLSSLLGLGGLPEVTTSGPPRG